MKADTVLLIISIGGVIGTAVTGGFTQVYWWFGGTVVCLGLMAYSIATIRRREFVSGRNFEKNARDKGYGTWLEEDEE